MRTVSTQWLWNVNWLQYWRWGEPYVEAWNVASWNILVWITILNLLNKNTVQWYFDIHGLLIPGGTMTTKNESKTNHWLITWPFVSAGKDVLSVLFLCQCPFQHGWLLVLLLKPSPSSFSSSLPSMANFLSIPHGCPPFPITACQVQNKYRLQVPGQQFRIKMHQVPNSSSWVLRYYCSMK